MKRFRYRIRFRKQVFIQPVGRIDGNKRIVRPMEKAGCPVKNFDPETGSAGIMPALRLRLDLSYRLLHFAYVFLRIVNILTSSQKQMTVRSGEFITVGLTPGHQRLIGGVHRLIRAFMNQ